MSKGLGHIDTTGRLNLVDAASVAYDGQVYAIQRVCVAEAGTVREVFPNVITPPQPEDSIVWDTEDKLSENVDVIPGDAVAFIGLLTQEGNIALSIGDGSDWGTYEIPAINPPPDGPAQYVWRVDDVGGNLNVKAPAQIGVWQDVFENGKAFIWEYWIVNSNDFASVVTGEATVTFAVDDGAGNPVGGTEVAATIILEAEVVAASLTWTRNPKWRLRHRTIGEQAQCSVRSFKGGLAAGYEGVVPNVATGPDPVITQRYTVAGSGGVVVQAVNVLGDPNDIGGSPLGQWLPANQDYRWRINAFQSGVDLENELEIRYSTDNGITYQWKRVNMRVSRDDGPIEIPDELTPANPNNYLLPAYSVDGRPAQATVTINPDGTIFLISRPIGDALPNPVEIWSDPQPPSQPANFQCRLRIFNNNPVPNVGGGSPYGDDAWLSCALTNSWSLLVPRREVGDVTETVETIWYLEIRPVGGNFNERVVRQIFIQVTSEETDQPIP